MSGLPMLGTTRVRVHAVRDIDLHGDRYHDLAVTQVGDPDGTAPTPVRIPSAMCPVRPAAGACLELDVLMGQVQAVRTVEA